MTIIHTPVSIDEADHRLTHIDKVVMSSGWERSAILATVVRLTGSGAHNRSLKREIPFQSPNEYAKRGIPGLRDDKVIRLYVQRWLDANDGEYPDPDEDIELPDEPWPPTSPENRRYANIDDKEAIEAQAEADGTGASKALDIAKNLKAMAAAIKASPAVAAAARAALYEAAEAWDEHVEEQQSEKEPPTLNEAWGKWLGTMSHGFTKGARLAERTETEDEVLGVYAACALELYHDLTERRIDREIRAILDGEGADH